MLEFNAYVCPNRYLTASFKLNNPHIIAEEYRQQASDKFAALWLKRDTWFQHLQLLGPALGFLLTVSSLIEALNPLRSGNDLEGFLAGIHVALISTFLGLLLRLVALEGARVNDKLGELFQLHLASIVTEPASLMVQPVANAVSPVSAQAPAATGQVQPAIVLAQPATVLAQPTTVLAQPATVLAQPATVLAQPATVLTQPASASTQQASEPTQPSIEPSKPDSPRESNTKPAVPFAKSTE